MEQLEKITYSNRSLKSVSTLPKKNLKKVYLGDQCQIEDNNVNKFLDFPLLEHVSFPKKKGYQYNARELNQLLKERS